MTVSKKTPGMNPEKKPVNAGSSKGLVEALRAENKALKVQLTAMESKPDSGAETQDWVPGTYWPLETEIVSRFLLPHRIVKRPDDCTDSYWIDHVSIADSFDIPPGLAFEALGLVDISEYGIFDACIEDRNVMDGHVIHPTGHIMPPESMSLVIRMAPLDVCAVAALSFPGKLAMQYRIAVVLAMREGITYSLLNEIEDTAVRSRAGQGTS